jgi:transcription initiation factor IIE alpha subunit
VEGLIVLALYAALGVGVVVVAVVFYLRAELSRSSYHCPKCHTSIRVELMEANHCNVCGAWLRSNQDEDAKDEPTA